MKNEYQVSERNAIVEDHLWCIDSVIRQNYTLIKAARLDLDDVYQTLALRLIRAVAGYNPEKGILRQHIFAQLQYELLSCKSARALYGFPYAPFALWGTVVSVEAMEEAGVDWESQIAAGCGYRHGRNRSPVSPAALRESERKISRCTGLYENQVDTAMLRL